MSSATVIAIDELEQNAIFAAVADNAKHGDIDAQLEMAERMLTGDGAEHDPEKGFIYLRAFATRDEHPPAMFLLGECYAQGLGVEKDPVQAVAWYQKAADLENPDAQYALGRLYEKEAGSKRRFWRRPEFVRLYKLAANQGLAQAQHALGDCYEHKKGFRIRHRKKAAKQYRSAAEQGFALAQNALARFHEAGIGGVEYNIPEARKLLEAAAAQGLPIARYNFGIFHEEGIGGDKNLAAAFALYAGVLAEKHFDPNLGNRIKGLARNARTGLDDAGNVATVFEDGTKMPSPEFNELLGACHKAMGYMQSLIRPFPG